jgi:hypothetical protein
VRSKTTLAAVAVLALLVVGPSPAAFAQSLSGDINGVELITQELGGQAVFLLRFTGTINNRPRSAIGIAGLNHESLPSNNTSQPSMILGGNGTIYAGFRAYKISEVGGTITVNPDGPFLFIFPLQFQVLAEFKIGDVQHYFDGVLRHDTLPFSLRGTISTVPPPGP